MTELEYTIRVRRVRRGLGRAYDKLAEAKNSISVLEEGLAALEREREAAVTGD